VFSAVEFTLMAVVAVILEGEIVSPLAERVVTYVSLLPIPPPQEHRATRLNATIEIRANIPPSE
jgi:hypothetical protein